MNKNVDKSTIVITKLVRDGKEYMISALCDQGNATELHVRNLQEKSLLGSIYVGRVQKVVKNLNAAFIEIAPGFACYYPLNEMKDPLMVRKLPSPNLVQGDELVVQVSRDAIKSKAPSVTTNLNISGRYLVLTLENKKIGVSSKIETDQRNHYKELLTSNRQLKYGVIVRTNAAEASDQTILDEYDRLVSRMEEIESFAHTRSCFSCLMKGKEDYLSFVRRFTGNHISEIVTDLEEVYNSIQKEQEWYLDLREIPLRIYADSLQPLYKVYSLESQLESAVKKQVWLKSGGYLVIEPTEALTVIDVNTGKSIAKKNPQEHFLMLNKEAALEAARQIRLRNLSGIIIIDFIDLDRREDRETLMTWLRQCVKSDPIPVQVHDMTGLQLVEVTRKKVEKTLKEQLT